MTYIIYNGLNSASATTAQQLRFSNHRSATNPPSRFSNCASATYVSATKTQFCFSKHASATKTHSRFSNQTSATRISPPLATTCKVTSYTSYQKNPNSSGKYIQAHILHVISKSANFSGTESASEYIPECTTRFVRVICTSYTTDVHMYMNPNEEMTFTPPWNPNILEFH